MKTRRHYLWILPLLVALFWLIWPSSDKAGKSEDSQQGLAAGRHHAKNRALVDGGAGSISATQARRVKNSGEGADLTRVDLILADDGISHEQAALQLREIAMDPMNSVEDRLEALQHGLNLHLETFADFAQQKELPSDLASHFLHEIINHNDSPGIQIRSYMALMDHPDGNVSELAMEMLALEVGDEEQQSTREKLLVVGESKLALLESQSGK
jgi:hypothetical protein